MLECHLNIYIQLFLMLCGSKRLCLKSYIYMDIRRQSILILALSNGGVPSKNVTH